MNVEPIFPTKRRLIRQKNFFGENNEEHENHSRRII